MSIVYIMYIGADGEIWTRTVFLPMDFKSIASANFATSAYKWFRESDSNRRLQTYEDWLLTTASSRYMEQIKGVEPSPLAWEANMLTIEHHICIFIGEPSETWTPDIPLMRRTL